MSIEHTVGDLLLRWEELCEQGQTVSLENLCRDCPELLEPLRRQVQALRRMGPLLRPKGEMPATEGGGEPGALPAVPGYEVLREIGRGGMGMVYVARQLRLGRVVALKMILAGGQAGARQLARFKTEAEAIARLAHPNIVVVHEVGEQEGRPFFSLEYCAGGSLDGKLAGTPLEAREAAKLVQTLAGAMQAAHEANVIHRDLKPANVLLSSSGVSEDRAGDARFGETPLDDLVPKITDFGLAKQLDQAGATQTGEVMGTPSYMAPEQAKGNKDVGPAVDVYALGAILYECITGRPPFKAATALDTLLQVIAEAPAPPRQLNARAPVDLETICLKCLHKDPRGRYATAGELAADLRRFQAGEPIRARPVGRAERALKWVRRNPVVAALSAATALALIVGAATAGVLAVRESRAAEAAQEQAGRADREAENAREEARRADRKAADEARARGEAEAERLKTQSALDREAVERERAERLLYDGQIESAQREWEAGNLSAARAHLRSCRWDYRGLEHRYLSSLFNHRQVLLRGGGGGYVYGVAISGDGRRFVSEHNRTVKVWDAYTGKVLHTLRGHTNAVMAVAASDNGECIVSGGLDGTVKVWDGRTGKERYTLTGHAGAVNGVAVSGDGTLAASGGADRTVRLWDVRTGKLRRSLKGHMAVVRSVAVSGDKLRILSGSMDMTAKVWEVRTGSLLRTFYGHAVGVMSAAFSPDGRRAVSSGQQGVKVWEVQTGKEVLRLEGHAGPVRSVAYSGDGARIVSGSSDRTVKVHDAQSGAELLTLRGHNAGLGGVAVSGDGARVLSGGFDTTLRVWDARTGIDPSRLAGHAKQVTCLAVTGDGRIVSGGMDGTVKVWNARRGNLMHLLPADARVGGVAVSSDGGGILSVGRDGGVKVFDARTRKVRRTFQAGRGGVSCVAVSSDGGRIVIGNADNSVSVWDARTDRELFRLAGHNRPSLVAAMSRDGSRVAAGTGFHGAVKVWDGRTGKELFTLRALLHDLAISDDGGLIAGGSGTVLVWDGRTGKELHDLAGHSSDVLCVTFAGADRLVSGGRDGVLKVWDVHTGKELVSIPGPGGVVTSIAVGEEWIVCGTNTGAVKVYDASTSDELFLRGSLSREAWRSVAVSPDGKRIFAEKTDGRITAWDGLSGQVLREHPEQMPAGGREARSADGRLRVRIDGSLWVERAEDEPARRRRQTREREILGWGARFDAAWARRQLEWAEEAADDFAAAYHLAGLLKAEPWNAHLHVYQAHVLARLGRRPESATALTRALMLNPRVSLWPIDPGARQRGNKAAQAGDWAKAVRAFRIAAGQPNAPAVLLAHLLAAQTRLGDADGVRETVGEIARRLERETAAARKNLLWAALLAPWPKEEGQVLLRYTRQEWPAEGDGVAKLHRGAALFRSGRQEQAAGVLAEANAPDGRRYLATSLFGAMAARAQGKHEEAARLLEEAERWLGRQTVGRWQERAYYEALLAEARRRVNTPPRMTDAK